MSARFQARQVRRGRAYPVLRATAGLGVLLAAGLVPLRGQTTGPVTLMDPFEVTNQNISILGGDASEPNTRMTGVDVYTTAGAAGDVNRALAMLPGMASVDDGNALYVKGGGPEETVTYVDDIRFPATRQDLAPAGTFSQTLRPYYLRRIEFYPGSVPARFGDALSGAVSLNTIRSDADAHQSLDLSIGGVFAMAQQPIGRESGIAVAGAETNTTELFKLNRSPVHYTEAPRGNEIFIQGDTTTKSGVIVEGTAYHQDTREGLTALAGNFSGTYAENVSTSFGAIRISGMLDDWQWKAAMGGGEEKHDESLGVLNLENRTDTADLIGSLNRELSPKTDFGLGGSVLWDGGRLAGVVPATNALAPGSPSATLDNRTHAAAYGGFSAVHLHLLPRFEIVPSIRYDWFQDERRGALQPRLSLVFPLFSDMVGQVYSGRLAQPPSPNEKDSAPLPLRFTTDDETSLTLTRKKGPLVLQAGGYYKNYRQLNQFNDQYIASGGGVGQAEGVWAYAQWSATPALKFSTSYSVGRSTRTDPNTGVRAPSRFDVRDTVVERSDFGWNNFIFSLVGRFSTGKPYTSVVGANFDPATNSYDPILGAPMAARLPDNYRIDAAVSRIWVIGSLPVVTYLSINNITNHSNTFSYAYSANYSRKIPGGSLFLRTLYFGFSINH